MTVWDGHDLLPLHTAFDLLLWVPKAPNAVLCCSGKAVYIGDVSRMFGYADALYSGRGGFQDIDASVKLLKQAAEAGNTNAMKKLASLYDRGDGVERDHDAAKYWYNKAVGLD